MAQKIVEEKSFSQRVREFLLEERGIDIDGIDYMEMPENRERYNLDNVIGNVNLTARRFTIKSEVHALTDEFLSMPLP